MPRWLNKVNNSIVQGIATTFAIWEKKRLSFFHRRSAPVISVLLRKYHLLFSRFSWHFFTWYFSPLIQGNFQTLSLPLCVSMFLSYVGLRAQNKSLWFFHIHLIKLSVLFLKKKNHQKHQPHRHSRRLNRFLFQRCKDENQMWGESAHASHSAWHEWLYRREITRVKLDLWFIEMGELLGPGDGENLCLCVFVAVVDDSHNENRPFGSSGSAIFKMVIQENWTIKMCARLRSARSHTFIRPNIVSIAFRLSVFFPRHTDSRTHRGCWVW